jgi:PAS domain S-box-containing protein
MIDRQSGSTADPTRISSDFINGPYALHQSQSEERLALISEAVAEGIYDWNIADKSLFVSPRLVEMFGFADVNLTAQDWFSLVHASDRERYRCALRECFRGSTPRLDCEYRILVRSGEHRWVEDHGLPVRNAEGRAVRLVGAVSDVTPRKEMERALRESEERHRLALEAINESVYEWDILSGAMYYSPRLYAALGLRPADLSTAEDWLQRICPNIVIPFVRTSRTKVRAWRLNTGMAIRTVRGTGHDSTDWHPGTNKAAPSAWRARLATSR